MATECTVRQCVCAACQAGDHPEKQDHRFLNLILSLAAKALRQVPSYPLP
jgi:hypothetical protein